MAEVDRGQQEDVEDRGRHEFTTAIGYGLTGVFLFTQSYEQDAINSFSPFVVAPLAVSQHSPRAAPDDFGLGLFGQGTVTVGTDRGPGSGSEADSQSLVAGR